MELELNEVIENLEYLISDSCTDTQFDYIEEIEIAIQALKKQIPMKSTEINESKTAYDVDKVVEQLQKLSDNCWQYADLDQRSLGKARAFDKAIEIVKDGVKNDN